MPGQQIVKNSVLYPNILKGFSKNVLNIQFVDLHFRLKKNPKKGKGYKPKYIFCLDNLFDFLLNICKTVQCTVYSVQCTVYSVHVHVRQKF